jgi:hypothetical protein
MADQLHAVLVAWLSLAAAEQSPSIATPNLQFFCNTGYSESDCELQLRRLWDVLAKMDLTELGDWSWILVRSQDWGPILRRAGRDPDSPAFTILEKRQTFLEEAMFNTDPARSRTLLEKWRIPLDQFPKYAVVHELAHALCREADEQRARVYAVELQKTGRVRCRGRNDP